MAVMNYGLVADNSNFLPYSFDELAKPFLLYQNAYEREAEKLEKYETDFATFTLPEEASQEYKDALNSFREKFSLASDTFNLKGLGAARRQLKDAYRIARTLIAPMQEALKLYKKDVDAVSSLGGDAIVGVEPNINDYLGGVNKPIKHISRKQTEAEAAALGLVALNILKGDALFLSVLKDLYVLQSFKGNSPEEIAGYLAEVYSSRALTEGARKVRELINNYKQSIDTSGWSNDKLKQLDQTIYTGFLSGLKDESRVIDDKSFLQRLQASAAARNLDEFNRQKQLFEATYKIDPETGQLTYNDASPIGQAVKAAADKRGTPDLGNSGIVTIEDAHGNKIEVSVRKVGDGFQYMDIITNSWVWIPKTGGSDFEEKVRMAVNNAVGNRGDGLRIALESITAGNPPQNQDSLSEETRLRYLPR